MGQSTPEQFAIPGTAVRPPRKAKAKAARLPTCMTATTRSEFCSRSTPTSVRSGLVALRFAITSQSSSATNSAHICEGSATISFMSTPQTLPYQSRRIPPENFFDRPVKYPRRGPNCGANIPMPLPSLISRLTSLPDRVLSLLTGPLEAKKGFTPQQQVRFPDHRWRWLRALAGSAALEPGPRGWRACARRPC